MFKKWFKKKKPVEYHSVDIDVLIPATPVKQWVNRLLFHMHQASIESFTLERSKGIPSVPYDDEILELAEITFDNIINTLKVMSGLDPVSYIELKAGVIPICINGTDYDIKTTFKDHTDQTCTIDLIKTKA